MKRLFALLAALALLLAGCGAEHAQSTQPPGTQPPPATEPSETSGTVEQDVTDILLDGDSFTCDSEAVSAGDKVLCGFDEDGTPWGSNGSWDYSILRITAPGTYRLSGSYDGQIQVDLGEGAETDPTAVVTLILDNVEIACDTGPSILFYRVYECAPGEDFALTPDLSGAGAVVELADDSENLLDNFYATSWSADVGARYDSALWSCQSLRLEGSSGQLLLTGNDNGLRAQGHLELNGGCLATKVGGRGIYACKNGRSVVTVNGGEQHLTGQMLYGFAVDPTDSDLGAEGIGETTGGCFPGLAGGMEADGAIVINGGATYCSGDLPYTFPGLSSLAPEAGERITITPNEGLGLRAARGIWLNGGTVVVGGLCGSQVNAASRQQYMELSFAEALRPGSVLELRHGETVVFRTTLLWSCSSLLISAPELALNVPYTLTVDGVVQQHSGLNYSLPGIGDKGPPDVEIPPQPTQPVLPASVEEPVGDINDAQPPTDGFEPPEDGWVEITPIPGGSIGGGEITLPGFPVLIGLNTEFILTSQQHSFTNIRPADGEIQ